MLLAHFHFLGWNAPVGLLAFQVKLSPLRITEFARTYEHQRCQLQGKAGDGVAGIAVDGAEQLADASGFSDGSVVFGYDWGEGAQKVRGYVMRGALGLHSVAEYLGTTLASAMRSFVKTSVFDAFEYLEYVSRAQLGDWT